MNTAPIPAFPATYTEHNLTIVVDVDASGHAAVRVAGELDLASSPLLASCLENCRGAGPQVHIDLGAVTFMDAAGYATLLEGVRRATGRGQALVLARIGPRVERLLRLLDVDGELGGDSVTTCRVVPSPARTTRTMQMIKPRRR